MIEKRRGKCRGDGFLWPRKLILIILRREEEEGTQHTTHKLHCHDVSCTVWGGNLFQRFCKLFSTSPLACLGQHGSCNTAQQTVDLSVNMLQNLRNVLAPQTVVFSPMVVKSENSTISRKATHPRTATHDASRRRHFVTTTAGGSRQQASTMPLYARRARQ